MPPRRIPKPFKVKHHGRYVWIENRIDGTESDRQRLTKSHKAILESMCRDMNLRVFKRGLGQL